MANVSSARLRRRFNAMAQRRLYYERKSEQPGRLARHEVWRHAYLAHPYLIGARDDRVAHRFRDVFLNVMEIEPGGKLGPVPFARDDIYMQTFTHLLEEYEFRLGGLPPDDVVQAAREPLVRYFEHGAPIGFKMFEGYSAPTTPVLVKYGKRQHLEPMLRHGDLKLSNAESYNNPALLDAARDNETTRTFVYPTYKERMRDESSTSFEGHTIDFGNDDFEIPLVFNDYYLFSLCECIHHRMATDFNADAALVIRDPKRFTQALTAAFAAQHPDWIGMSGKVVYYDPYRDRTKFRIPEMAKHFRYGYQREFRVAFRPRCEIASELEPLYLSIGPMADYADLLLA